MTLIYFLSTPVPTPENARGGADLVSAPPRRRSKSLISAYGAALTIDWIVKKFLSTAPMLMYQHSRSGEPCPGR